MLRENTLDVILSLFWWETFFSDLYVTCGQMDFKIRTLIK